MSRTLALSAAAVVAVGLSCPSLHAGAGGIRFREVSRVWGVDFHHHHGGSGRRYIVETTSGGVVVFDFDSDGDQDLLFVDGGPLPGYAGEAPGSRLYRNDGQGRFVDVTERAGIATQDYGHGAVAADPDGDGDLDLYLTAFGPNRLWRNDGDGSFSEVTATAGVAGNEWSSGAAFSDVDRDGDLDLYVANYVDFTFATHRTCGDAASGLEGYCRPSFYATVGDRFYRNRGDGTFADETGGAGFGGADGAGLGVVFGDLDDDGWPDLYVANDETPNFLFRNRRDGTFEDISLTSGTAFSDAGAAEAGMGVDLGDVDGDGRLDIVVTNYELETNALYGNTGGGFFIDARYRSQLARFSLRNLGWGIVLADLDLDADLDLVIANGHVLDNASELDPQSRYPQPNQVLENLGGGRFQELEDHGLEVVRPSRGLASGDLDGDGDLDLVVNNSNQASEVYENLTPTENRWLQIDLRGPGSNRLGIGARVEAEAGGRRQLREVRAGSSYLSQNALTLHFGLAAAAEVDRLVVSWPGGRRQVLVGLPANRRLLISE